MALIERGFSQKDMARVLGMVYSTFNMKLRGERHFTESEREKLAMVLGKPESELFPTKLNTGKGQNTQEKADQQKAANSG
jgi:transcriptional regulator with XRE-family HTH domain